MVNDLETMLPIRKINVVFELYVDLRSSIDVYRCRPHIRESKTVLESEFHAVDSGF